MAAIPTPGVVVGHAGHYYVLHNGRWKEITEGHYFTLVADGVVTYVDAGASADWAAYTDAYGNPGPL